MKYIYRLSAITAEGFGGKEKYTELATVENEGPALDEAKRQFALKYGVMLDLVKASLVRIPNK